MQVARLTAIIMAGLLLRDAYSIRPIPPRWMKLIDPRIYQTVYFSCGLQWAWQCFYVNLNLFPRIMTSQVGIFISVILLSLLRRRIEKDRLQGMR